MQAANGNTLESLRYKSAKAACDALVAIGGKREARNLYVVRGLHIRVYKRGTESFALQNITAFHIMNRGSIVASVLADYETGNVRTIRA